MRRRFKPGQLAERKRKRPGCTGKLRYNTSAEADFEIERAAVLRGENLRAYHCYHCECWHLTSQPKRGSHGYEGW